MLYAILCYNDEATVTAWSKEQDDLVMKDLLAVQSKLAARGKLGPVARLQGTAVAKTLRKGKDAQLLDGPFAETKEQFLGFYVVDVASLEEAADFARELAQANPGPGAYELRPLALFLPNEITNPG